jgi:hypothetical protein
VCARRVRRVCKACKACVQGVQGVCARRVRRVWNSDESGSWLKEEESVGRLKDTCPLAASADVCATYAGMR